jgi:hypothetical protein
MKSLVLGIVLFVVVLNSQSADAEKKMQIIGTMDCGPNRENNREPTTARIVFTQSANSRKMFSALLNATPQMGKVTAIWVLDQSTDKTYVTAIERRENGDSWNFYFEGGAFEGDRALVRGGMYYYQKREYVRDCFIQLVAGTVGK